MSSWPGGRIEQPWPAKRRGEMTEARREPEAASPFGVLVGLQRSAGNQAVTRLLGGAAPRSSLARLGVLVLIPPRKKDEPDYVPLITDIAVIGRPALRLIAHAEGSHVAAWAIFADIMRRRLVGHDVKTAYRIAADMLRTEATALLQAWAVPPAEVLQAAEAAMAALAGFQEEADEAFVLSHLQEMIGAWLTLHNLHPGAAVFMGKGQAVGKGEPQKLGTLRSYEAGDDVDPLDLAESLFGLLDAEALSWILGQTEVTPAAPGMNPHAPDRIGRLVLRALGDLAVAYPRSFHTVMMDRNALITWLTTRGLPADLPGPLPVVDVDDMLESSMLESTAAGGPAKRAWMCQFLLAPPQHHGAGAGDPLVAGLRTLGRPPTLIKGNQGHHAYSWEVEMLRLRTLIAGRTLSEAALTLTELSLDLLDDLVLGLGWLRDEDLSSGDEEQRQYADEAILWTLKDLKRALDDVDLEDEDPFHLLLCMQDLAAAYMGGVNMLPLVSAEKGANADSGGEGTAFGVLMDYEAGNTADPATAGANLLRLLDFDAVRYLHGAAPAGLGYPSDADQRVVIILRRYLRAVRAAFPRAVADSKLDTPSGIRFVLTALKIEFGDIDAVLRAVFGSEAQAADLDRDGDTPMLDAFDRRARAASRKDDEDYVEAGPPSRGRKRGERDDDEEEEERDPKRRRTDRERR